MVRASSRLHPTLSAHKVVGSSPTLLHVSRAAKYSSAATLQQSVSTPSAALTCSTPVGDDLAPGSRRSVAMPRSRLPSWGPRCGVQMRPLIDPHVTIVGARTDGLNGVRWPFR